jgi:crossover junction endodeoxyribonuclease RusA
MTEYKFEIPLRPPSVNTYWRKWQNRMVISKNGREFKKQMTAILKNDFSEEKPLDGSLVLNLGLFFKDKRRRDIDNYCKGILDSMTGIVFEDDSQIEELGIKKHTGCGEDKVVVRVRSL